MNADLLQRITHSPDDLDAHRVYADALVQDDDPRGVWMNLHIARELDPSPERVQACRAWFFAHGREVVGALVDYPRPWQATWRHGVLRGLALSVDQERELAVLEGLVAAQTLFGLESLRLNGTARFDQLADWTVQTVGNTLVRLHMGPMSLGYGVLNRSLANLLEGCPRLTALRLPPCRDVEGIGHSRLETLDWVPAPGQTLALRDGAFPNLVDVRVPRAQLEAAQAEWETVQLVNDPSAETDGLLTPVDQTWWRRWERNGRFWMIRRKRERLELRWGRGAGNGTRKEVVARSLYGAANDYRARVQGKRNDGWTEVFVG